MDGRVSCVNFENVTFFEVKRDGYMVSCLVHSIKGICGILQWAVLCSYSNFALFK